VPTYEYVCESCGNQYEKRESFDAKPRQKCPACGKMARRMLSAPAVVFKGAGFYKTDSRGGSTSSETSSSGETATPASVPDVGHSHGPGAHAHDAPATERPAAATTTETAAAS
jgi:putative FmdB family regulatory protein